VLELSGKASIGPLKTDEEAIRARPR